MYVEFQSYCDEDCCEGVVLLQYLHKHSHKDIPQYNYERRFRFEVEYRRETNIVKYYNEEVYSAINQTGHEAWTTASGHSCNGLVKQPVLTS